MKLINETLKSSYHDKMFKNTILSTEKKRKKKKIQEISMKCNGYYLTFYHLSSHPYRNLTSGYYSVRTNKN